MGKNVSPPDARTRKLVQALGEKQDELDYFSRILHEDVGQVLTVVGLHLDLLRQDHASDSNDIASKVIEIQTLLEKAIGDVRQLSYRLNPGIVPRSGFRYALDTLVGEVRDGSSANIRLLFDSNVHLPTPAAVAMFEIASQALRNAVAHSGGSRIELVVQLVHDDVKLEVSDNGCGFDTNAVGGDGLGLICMNEQARRSGIDLSLESSPAGTAVLAVYSITDQANKQKIEDNSANGVDLTHAARNSISG